MKVERDSQGKTRVVKGDKSGLGGQYAPDNESLKRMLKHYAEQAKLIREKKQNNTINEMSLEDYNEAIRCKEALEVYYSEYNKQQQELNREFQEDYTTDDKFTYFADFTPDVPSPRGLMSPRGDDGQPKGWELRIGSRRNSSKTDTGFYSTREEALDSLKELHKARKSNPYVKEQSKLYSEDKEKSEAVELPLSAPLGPWVMKLAFLEPKPNLKTENRNGYHAGWVVVASSPNHDRGNPVFINHQGFETRDEALAFKNEVKGSLQSFEHKDRYIHIEGQGNVLYNNLPHEKYESLINSYAFKPQPWLGYDILTDYYPKSKYQGD